MRVKLSLAQEHDTMSPATGLEPGLPTQESRTLTMRLPRLPGRFCTFFKNQNIYLKRCFTLTFIFTGFTPKDPAWKSEFLCIFYISKMKRRSTKAITYRTSIMLFKHKQVSLPKISLILQEMNIDPKTQIRPFLHISLQLQSFVNLAR